MTCSQCQAPLSDGAKYCGQCGAKLTERMHPIEGDRRVVTVLFTDVSGFTSLSEQLDPEQVAALMNDLFGVLTEPIYRYGGVVDKYIGDAVMATFGAPVAHEDDPERALWAAWDMQQAAKTFSCQLEARLGLRIALRIGVHTGLVVAGEVGGHEKREYTVLGETVHLAQRMESCAEVGTVRVTDETYHLTRHAFRFESRPSVSLPGRSRPVPCHELLGPADVALDHHEVFVGRTTEQQCLEQAWSRARDGQAQGLLVLGEAGIGKTALLKSALRSPLQQGAVHWAKCRPNEFAVSMDLVGAVLRALLGLGVHLTDQDALGGALAAPEVPLEAREAFEYLLSGRGSPFMTKLAPEFRKALVFRHMNDLVVAKAVQRPCVLVLEDLHWCDEASAEWIMGLLQTLRRSKVPLLLVMSMRPAERVLPLRVGPFPVQAVDLTPLAPGDASELIQQVMATAGSPPLPDMIVQQLCRRAGGNPRFLAALAAAFSNEATAGHLQGRTLPVSIMGYLLARLDGLALPPLEQQALDAAAVLAGQATLSRIERLLEDRPTGPVASLEGLQLLQVEDQSVSFRNPLMQEAVYERILLKRRRELHAVVGGLLEAEAQHPALVAEHYVRAERALLAARYLSLAAERSLAHYSNKEALQLVAAARGWLDRCGEHERWEGAAARLMEMEASAQAALGDFESALVISSELIAMASPGERPARYRLHASLLRRNGKLTEALETCVKGLALGAGAQALLLPEYADALQMQGDYQAALATANGALAMDGLEPRVRAHLMGVAGLACFRMRRLEEAYGLLRAAVDTYHQCGDLYGKANALNNLGSVCDGMGRLTEATECYAEGSRMAERVGDARLQSMLLNNLSMIAYRREDYAGAAAGFRRALEMHQDMLDRNGEGIALCNLGETYMRLGDDHLAESHLFQSVMVLEEIRAKGMVAEAYRQLASLKLRQEQFEMALSLAQRALTLAEETAQPVLQGVALDLASQACLAMGRPAESLRCAEASVQVLRALGRTYELGNSLMQLGRALEASQQDAVKAFSEASLCYGEAGADRESAEAGRRAQSAS